MHLIVHISDPHLDGTETAAARFRTVVDHITGLSTLPDAIVISGDIQQAAPGGPDAVYGAVAQALPTGIPVLAMPGNSDARDPLRARFGTPDDQPRDPDAPLNSRLDVGTATLIGLDSSVPGQFYGELADATLFWFREQLAGIPADRLVIVAMHHPPVELAFPFVDALRLRNPDALGSVLEDHPNVRAILVGHTHAATIGSFAGRPVLVAPGISSTPRLPWEHRSGDPEFSPFPSGPGLMFHLVADDGRLTSYTRMLG